MGYESARSTVLLATHCLCCGRPLRDPLSVETGVGPVCRDKYGYTTQGNPETRAACSKLIHAAAQPGLTATQVYAFADKIEKLGFDGVAARVRERFARAFEWENENKAKPVRIKRAPYSIHGQRFENAIWLHTPYEKRHTKVFNAELKAAITGTAQRTGTKDGDTFWWIINPSRAADVHGLLKAHFDGRLCQVKDGEDFIIGEKEKREAAEKADEDFQKGLEMIEAMKRDMEREANGEANGETVAPTRTPAEIAADAVAKAESILALNTPAVIAEPESEMVEDWGDLD